jgi:hypothetical protein
MTSITEIDETVDRTRIQKFRSRPPLRTVLQYFSPLR